MKKLCASRVRVHLCAKSCKVTCGFYYNKKIKTYYANPDVTSKKIPIFNRITPFEMLNQGCAFCVHPCFFIHSFFPQCNAPKTAHKAVCFINIFHQKSKSKACLRRTS